MAVAWLSLILATALLITLLLWPSLLVRRLLAPLAPEVIYCGSGCRHEMAITIDDGPTRSQDPRQPDSLTLLRLLNELEVPVTFFLVGEHLRRDGGMFVRQALEAGHAIGHHMDRDCLAVLLSANDLQQQIQRTEQDLRSAAEAERQQLRWFRPGGGWFNAAMLRLVMTRGYRIVLGTVWPWDTLHPPLAFQRWFVLNNAHPGAIVVLHDRPDTIASTMATLRGVVPLLRRRGYRFVSLDQLLA